MFSAAHIYSLIALLVVFGFLATTYGKDLDKVPDRLHNPVIAIGFGVAGLVAGLAALGTVTYLCASVLVDILHHLHVW